MQNSKRFQCKFDLYHYGIGPVCALSLSLCQFEPAMAQPTTSSGIDAVRNEIAKVEENIKALLKAIAKVEENINALHNKLDATDDDNLQLKLRDEMKQLRIY